MFVVKNELERFQRDTDALARGDSRFLRVAVRGAGVQPEHLESALGLLLALTSVSMSDEGRRTLKVIELAVDSTGSRTDDVAAVRANLIRALVAGGFSAFERSEQWLDADGPDEVVNTRWAKVKRNLCSDLAFIEAVGVDPDVYTQIQRASLYFSSRTMPDTNVRGARSLLGSHLLVARASKLLVDAAQVRLLARTDNPVLVQVDPLTSPQALLEVLETVDRLRKPGRVILSLAPDGNDVSNLAELVGAVTSSRPSSTWVANPVVELADPVGTHVDAGLAIARTSALSELVRQVGAHIAGFDVEVHRARLAHAPAVIAALGHDR